jgi:cytochrome c551/c552
MSDYPYLHDWKQVPQEFAQEDFVIQWLKREANNVWKEWLMPLDLLIGRNRRDTVVVWQSSHAKYKREDQNNRKTIQDAMYAMSKVWGVVIIEPGTYLIEKELTPYSNIQVIANWDATLQKQTTWKYSILKAPSVWVSNFSIKGITFDGRNEELKNSQDPTQDEETHIVSMYNSPDCFINIKVINAPGVWLIWSGDNTVLYKSETDNCRRQWTNRQWVWWTAYAPSNVNVRDEFGFVVWGYSKNHKVIYAYAENVKKWGLQSWYTYDDWLFLYPHSKDCGNAVEVGARWSNGYDHCLNLKIVGMKSIWCDVWFVAKTKQIPEAQNTVFKWLQLIDPDIRGSVRWISLRSLQGFTLRWWIVRNCEKGVYLEPGVEFDWRGTSYIDITSQGIASESNNARIANNYFKNITYDAYVSNNGATWEKFYRNSYENVGRSIVRNGSMSAAQVALYNIDLWSI